MTTTVTPSSFSCALWGRSSMRRLFQAMSAEAAASPRVQTQVRPRLPAGTAASTHARTAVDISHMAGRAVRSPASAARAHPISARPATAPKVATAWLHNGKVPGCNTVCKRPTPSTKKAARTMRSASEPAASWVRDGCKSTPPASALAPQMA